MNEKQEPAGCVAQQENKESSSGPLNSNMRPGYLKVSVRNEGRVVNAQINIDGMFFDHTTDELFCAAFAEYMRIENEICWAAFEKKIQDHPSDVKKYRAFREELTWKLNACVRRVTSHNTVAMLSEYGVMILEDAIRFFKEMKRLKRRSSHRKQSAEFFFRVVAQ